MWSEVSFRLARWVSDNVLQLRWVTACDDTEPIKPGYGDMGISFSFVSHQLSPGRVAYNLDVWPMYGNVRAGKSKPYDN